MNTIQLILQGMPWMEIAIFSFGVLAYGLGVRRGRQKEQDELKNIYLRLSKISWELQMRADQLSKEKNPKVTDRPTFLRRIK